VPTVTRLLVWRHGQTQWNATDRVQGQTDVDLDEVGEAQAERAAPLLAACRPDLIVSSDLRRAARTAAALTALTGLSIEYDGRLRERDYGPWQGLTLTEIAQRFPVAYGQWRATGIVTDLPIETPDDLGKRATAALRDVAERVGEGTAVVVTHGAAARAGCGGLLGWAHEVIRGVGALDNCHFTDLRHTPRRGWVLRAHNVGAG
jgi:probable phosphoglycerate mutase